MRASWVFVGAMAVGCGGPAASRPASTPTTSVAREITFVVDDYAAAREQARAAHKPLFVEAWARWCHSCLSLRAFVLHDPALRPLADRFVWLSVDVEKPTSAAFLAKYPSETWPTLWVVDAASETPILKWQRTATASELKIMLEDSAQVIANGYVDGEAGAAAARGDRAVAAGDSATAAKEYRAALGAAASDWPRRPRVVDALEQQLVATKDWFGCVDLAMAELPDMAPGTPRADVAVTALECARSVPKWSSKRQEVAPLVAIIRRMALDPNHPILADDRSNLFQALVGYYKSEGDAATAKQTARAWSSFLDEVAAHATSIATRVVFDDHRLEAYVELGEPERAIPMLQTSERELPEEAAPPALLARAYAAQQKWGDALAAIERAIPHEYGPHKLRAYEAKFEILFAKGDKPRAKKTLEEAIAFGEKLPLAGPYARLLADFKQRAAKL
jgi:tetratricopeptide (TPR) repeat protein